MQTADSPPNVLQSKEQARLLMELAQVLRELRRSPPEDLPPDGIIGWLDAPHSDWLDRLLLRLSSRSPEVVTLPALEQERGTQDRHEPLLIRELRLTRSQRGWLGIARIGEEALLPWDILPAAHRHLRLQLVTDEGSSFFTVPGDNGQQLARSSSRSTL